MPHPAFSSPGVAVVTGGAGGIGLAAARCFKARGMTVVLADVAGAALDATAAELSAHACPTDVSKPEDLARLKDFASAHGDVRVLMNNAGVGGPREKIWENPEACRRLLNINLGGVLNGVQAFVPEMLKRGKPGAVINTGSKQGITTPPGDAIYNVSKAGVKVATEQLAHELRNMPGAAITAHLLIPGYVFTGMTARGATENPPGAWSADQTAARLMEGLDRGEFYILCEDNETTRAMDERRIQWAADDIIKNRPALSRWHPDHAQAFNDYMAVDV